MRKTVRKRLYVVYVSGGKMRHKEPEPTVPQVLTRRCLRRTGAGCSGRLLFLGIVYSELDACIIHAPSVQSATYSLTKLADSVLGRSQNLFPVRVLVGSGVLKTANSISRTYRLHPQSQCMASCTPSHQQDWPPEDIHHHTSTPGYPLSHQPLCPCSDIVRHICRPS